jgi:TPR repeat protein
MTFIFRVISDAQGCTFVCLPLHVPRPIAGAPMYDMSLTCRERLCVVGFRLKSRLMQLLSQYVDFHAEPQVNMWESSKMMQGIVRRVAAGLAVAVRNKAANQAEELCASGQFAAASVVLQRAIDFGHLPSRALKAWLLLEGREGVVQDHIEAFKLVKEGTRLGCHHCQGVMALCYRSGFGCMSNAAQSLELAHKSSGMDSRYGQYALGDMYWHSRGGPARFAQALAVFRLAAAQNLDGAQYMLGLMYDLSLGVAEDNAEALRLYLLAAAQGLPRALYTIALCHQIGIIVPENKAEAIRWYMRAQAAGYPHAADALQRLGA